MHINPNSKANTPLIKVNIIEDHKWCFKDALRNPKPKKILWPEASP